MAKYTYRLAVESPIKFSLEIYSDVKNIVLPRKYEFNYEQSNTVTNSETKIFPLIKDFHKYIIDQPYKKTKHVDTFFSFISAVAHYYLFGEIDYSKAAYNHGKTKWSIRYGKSLIDCNKTLSYQQNLSKQVEKEEINIDAIDELALEIDKRIKEAFNMALLTSLPGQVYLSDVTESKMNMIVQKLNNFIANTGMHDVYGTNYTYRNSREKGYIGIVTNITAPPPFIMPEKFEKIGYEYLLKSSRFNMNLINELKNFISKYKIEISTAMLNDIQKNVPLDYIRSRFNIPRDYLYRFYFLTAITSEENNDLNYIKNNYTLLQSRLSRGVDPKIIKSINDIFYNSIKSHKMKILVSGAVNE